MTKFKMLSQRANTTLATIERGANSVGQMPSTGWFSAPTLASLLQRGYVVDKPHPVVSDIILVEITPLGAQYRAWARQQPGA